MTKTYTIKKGCHFSRHLPRLHRGSRMRVRFRFLGDCWFPLEVQDDYAINKLAGWSQGYHHNNSIRCGWTPSKEPGKIDLFFYLYNASKRIERPFATVEIGLEYDLEMELAGDLLSFRLRGNNITTVDSCYFKKPRCSASYVLFPYIGGQLPARWDTNIELEFLP